MERERLPRRDDPPQGLERGVSAPWMPHHPEATDHPVHVRVHRHDVPTEVEQDDAGGCLQTHSVEREKVVEHLVVGHASEETEIELAGARVDVTQNALDRPGLRPCEPAAPDGGLYRSDVRAFDLTPVMEALPEAQEGRARVRDRRVLREDGPNESGDEVPPGAALGPAVRALERPPDESQPSPGRDRRAGISSACPL